MIKEKKNRIPKLVDYYWVFRLVFLTEAGTSSRSRKNAILVRSPAAFVPWRCLKGVNYRLSGDLHFKCNFQNRNELRATMIALFTTSSQLCVITDTAPACTVVGGKHQWLRNFLWNANEKWHFSVCFWRLSRCKRNKENTACWQLVDYTDN